MLTPSWPPGYVSNGIVTYTKHISSSLRASGMKVTVFAGVQYQAELDSVDLKKYAPSRLTDKIMSQFHQDWFSYDRAWRMIVRAARSRSATDPLDLLEMEESFGMAGQVAKTLAVPVVVRLHGPWILVGTAAGTANVAASGRRIRREGDAFRGAAGVISPTRYSLDAVRRHYGIALDRAAIIPCAQPLPPESECWHPHRCVPESILFVGRFDRIKGGDVILEAFRIILERRPKAHLNFVGPDQGFLDDAGRTWNLKDRLDSVLGEKAARVRWFGEIPSKDIPPLRREAAVVVVASRTEQFPYAAVEALSYACPLVASDAGGLPEIVKEGVNGLMFPAGQAAALAAQIERLLENRDLGPRLGMEGRRGIGERCDPSRLAAQTLEYYSETRAHWQSLRLKA
jgi:glycosyltransferase involved in cell wall biosynthesis